MYLKDKKKPAESLNCTIFKEEISELLDTNKQNLMELLFCKNHKLKLFHSLCKTSSLYVGNYNGGGGIKLENYETSQIRESFA